MWPLSLILHYVMHIYSGHHKLVRWRLVTHAGIDSYSRLIVFLHCSNNNKVSTVYLKGIEQYGLPSRVRSDQGRENTMVAQHMLENRGLDHGSMIVGSSVHNQRGVISIDVLFNFTTDCFTFLNTRANSIL